MTYYLYVSAYELDKISGERRENNLVQIIRERYMPFGAKVEVIDAPQIKINSRKQEATAAQKIIGWIANQPKGTQSQDHHFKWWFENSPKRAEYLTA